MISLCSLYFFIYGPSRFEVDLSRFFKSGEVKFIVCNKSYTCEACKIIWKYIGHKFVLYNDELHETMGQV